MNKCSAPADDPASANCLETGKLISALVMQLAEEASVAGMVSLEELGRILKGVEATSPLFDMTFRRCQQDQLSRSVAFRRTQILGRVIAQPLEPLLVACPPALDRRWLPPLFEGVRGMVGDTNYTALDERARVIYFSQLKTFDYFEWSRFYADDQVTGLFTVVMLMLARAFRNYEGGKRKFIALMCAAMAGEDKTLFPALYFTLLTAMLRPLTLAGGVSPHRAYIEARMAQADRDTIDAFSDAFHADKRRHKKTPGIAAVGKAR